MQNKLLFLLGVLLLIGVSGRSEKRREGKGREGKGRKGKKRKGKGINK